MQILCFGDSNTWGTDCDKPEVKGVSARHDWKHRWTGLLSSALGSDFRVIDEGMPGRTTVFDDPLRDYRNGRHYLVPCLNSHRPLDLVILMLGTNDLQARYAAAPGDIAQGMETLVDLVQKGNAGAGGNAPPILIISPAPMRKLLPQDELSWAGAHDKLRQLPALYQNISTRYGCHFLDASAILSTDDMGTDGFHFAVSGHAKLGETVSKKVEKIFALANVPG